MKSIIIKLYLVVTNVRYLTARILNLICYELMIMLNRHSPYNENNIILADEKINNIVQNEISVVTKHRHIDVDIRLSAADNSMIDILNINFFDWEGDVRYKGGAERYVVDLAKLIKEQNYNVRIIQNANKYFERSYSDINIVGIPAKSGWDFPKLYKYYLENFSHANHTICSPLDIACCSANHKIIGINHGIYWDSPDNNWLNLNIKNYLNSFMALENVVKGVSVDTNFINWVRTIDYKLANKLEYIPNYFDPNEFSAYTKNFSNDDILILYPRRLYGPRGFYLAIKLVEQIVAKYDNVRFEFVGQAIHPESEIMCQYVDKYGDKVKWRELEMQDMPKAYSESQIVIIPTTYSEGTSLSCIEAMATNNAVVATNVGGLPNLIIDGYNGALINPHLDSLITAIESLICDSDMRLKYAENALLVSRSFNKSAWDVRWNKVIREFMT